MAEYWEVLIAVIAGTFVTGTCMDNSHEINRNIKGLEREVQEMKPKIQEKQVIGNSTPEKFYFIDGQRAYLAIDGKPIEQYANSSDLSKETK